MRIQIKSLNDEFQLFRNNSLQRRRFNKKDFNLEADVDETRVQLLQDEDEVEMDKTVPSFVAQAEGLDYQLDRLALKVSQLDELHKVKESKPLANFDDEDGQDANRGDKRTEAEIRILTREIGQSLGQCHHQIKSLQTSTSRTKGLEQVITRNLVQAMSNRLQDVSETFRKSQGDYLKAIETREAKTKELFGDFDLVTLEDDSGSTSLQLEPTIRGQISTQELLLMEEDTKHLEQREKEINEVVKSISELNTIFKDLAHMVSEQGTIIDRIDHNISNTQIKVSEGLKQLKKAEKYQKENRKIKCILILAVILVILLFALIIKAS